MSDKDSNPRGANAATVIGLLLALAVPLVASTGVLREVLIRYAPEDSLNYHLLREAFFWGLTILVLLVLTIGERQPLSAIGLKRLGGATILWALVGFALAFLSYPVGQYLVKLVGASTQATGTIEKLLQLPVWMLGLIVIRAGVCEEILFRGYGIERMTALTGSRVLGALIPALAFMFAHAGRFGIGYVVVLIPITTVLTALYLFRRDLGTNILTHILVDTTGFVMFYFMQPRT